MIVQEVIWSYLPQLESHIVSVEGDGQVSDRLGSKESSSSQGNKVCVTGFTGIHRGWTHETNVES